MNRPVEDLSYEEAFHELEELVIALEKNDQSLEASLALFERGQLLAKHCADLLDKAELQVQKISGNDLVDFIPEEPGYATGGG
jgi:exodeoxyribonuclease VII small subunit